MSDHPDQPDQDPDQPGAPVTPPTRRPGRPKGTTPATTSAERMRALRERARGAVEHVGLSDDLAGELTDSALLEALWMGFRQGHPRALGRLMSEAMSRANARATPEQAVRLAVIAESTLADMHAHDLDWIPYPRDPVTVTNIDPPPAPSPTPSAEHQGHPTGRGDYPPSVNAMALRMKLAGASHAAIGEAIREACGRAPHVKSVSGQLRRASRNTAVLAILAGEGIDPDQVRARYPERS